MCRKNKKETRRSCRDTSTRTKRVPPTAIRLKSLTRAGAAGVGLSHFSTTERRDCCANLTRSGAEFTVIGLIWLASIPTHSPLPPATRNCPETLRRTRVQQAKIRRADFRQQSTLI